MFPLKTNVLLEVKYKVEHMNGIMQRLAARGIAAVRLLFLFLVSEEVQGGWVVSGRRGLGICCELYFMDKTWIFGGMEKLGESCP